MNNENIKPFNPLLDVPCTDEEVELCLKHNRDELSANSLMDVYRKLRGRGCSVFTAYGTILKKANEILQNGRY